MGEYNRHAPHILGLEWVPIRQANYLPDQVTEVGYSFELPTDASIVSGGMVVAQVPERFTSFHSDPMFIYREGDEDKTGPVLSVFLSPTSFIASGAAYDQSGAAITTGTNVGPVSNSSDGDYHALFGDSGTPYGLLQYSFNPSTYQDALQGKRIVDIRLHYTAWETIDEDDTTAASFLYLRDTGGAGSGTNVVILQEEIVADTTLSSAVVRQQSLGYMNRFLPGSPFSSSYYIFPWRWEELDEFKASDGKRIAFNFQSSNTNSALYVGYVALEVRYCDENRVGWGANDYMAAFTHPKSRYERGFRSVMLKNTSMGSSVSMPAGRYTVAVVHEQINLNGSGIGDSGFYSQFARGVAPTLAAIRGWSKHSSGPLGKRIMQTNVVGDTFVVEDSDILPPLTLFDTSSFPVTGTHPYSQVIAAPVYDEITAMAEIDARSRRVPYSTLGYQQVRFYARRFGDTNVPLTLTGENNAGAVVSITPQQFDALPEIVDGWKEVTLRLPVDATMGPGGTSTEPDWRWSADGLSAGDRWEILGVDADTSTETGALSTGKVTYDDWTYDAVEGLANGIELRSEWKDLNDSTTGVDNTVDLVVVFSQDPPTVTGLGLSTLSQALTGLGSDECGIDNDCVPTAIQYQQLSWLDDTRFVCDTFTRSVTGGVGTSDTGQTPTIITGAASTFNVDGSKLTIDTDGGVPRVVGWDTVQHTDFDYHVLVAVSPTPSGTGSNGTYPNVWARTQDVNNFYRVQALFRPDSQVDFYIQKLVAGVQTNLASLPTVYDSGPGQWFHVRFRGINQTLYAKAWPDGQQEPPSWQMQVTDTSFASGYPALRAQLSTAGFANGGQTWFDDVRFMPAEYADCEFELQRSDEVDDWATIMRTPVGCVFSFDDYEARVGVESSYRIRVLNAAEFEGAWSTEVTGNITAPGVTVGGDGVGVLIFTSNEAPARALAYSMAWDSEAAQDFGFPEATTQRLSMLYGRDFPVAFRPLERGGAQFNRVLLVNAAAVPVPSLPGISNLRDLAWDDIPYVCVRDENGNRWFANVSVPNLTVRRNRRLYLASIEVAEVADQPYPSDPAG